MECDILCRTMGTWMNPQGKRTHPDPKIEIECTVRLRQVHDWETPVNKTNMSKQKAHITYHAIFQAKLGYTLGVTTFTEQEIRKVQRETDVAYRPKISLSRSFPNEVFQGLTEYGGREHVSFCTLQGYTQIKLLPGIIRNQDDTSKIFVFVQIYFTLKP